MKRALIGLLTLVAFPVMAQNEIEIRDARRANGETYDRLWKKAGFQPEDKDPKWTMALLRKRLDPWEFTFLVASMHDGVSDNGGWVHGMHCFFDEEPGSDLYLPPEEIIGAWKAIGSPGTVRAIQRAQSTLKRLGHERFDDLTETEWEALEAEMNKAYGEDEPSVELLFFTYAKQNQRVEQDGADQPATAPELKSEGKEKPKPESEGRSQ